MGMLRPIEGSKLQLAWSEPVDVSQQDWKAEGTSTGKDPHTAAKALKILRGKPLKDELAIKRIEPNYESLGTSDINQVPEILPKKFA